MNIQIISVGKIREDFIKKGIDEFLTRISPYSSIKVVEIPAEILKQEGMEDKARKIEAEKILAVIGENSYTIALEVKGTALSSEGLADKISDLIKDGYNQINFVIGSATGLDESVRKRADFLLSFSKMTFPHQLMRLILLEQVYRAFKIIKKEPYHK